MKKSADIEIAVQVRTVTEKAMLVSGDGETYVWVPKSQIADWSGSEELGAIAVSAVNWSSLDFSCLAAKQRSYQRAGDCLLDALGIAGLKIVRVDE